MCVCVRACACARARGGAHTEQAAALVAGLPLPLHRSSPLPSLKFGEISADKVLFVVGHLFYGFVRACVRLLREFVCACVCARVCESVCAFVFVVGSLLL